LPRSPDGSYSLPPGTLVASGDTLLPTQHNPAMQDIAAALGNSLDRNGAGVMRAPLDMGGYAVTNAGPGTRGSDLATVTQVAQGGVPVGAVLAYAGITPPAGYLLCIGQAVSRAEYPALFAALGSFYGAGDGLSTFNLPDMRGNTLVGQDNMGGNAAGRLTGATSLGAQLGAQAVTLTTAQMPRHAHTITDPGHAHGYAGFQTEAGVGLSTGNNARETAPRTTQVSGTGITIEPAGGDAAHPNVQPSLVSNFIIKATI